MEKEFEFLESRKIKDPEQLLFNIVSSCLLNEFRYYDEADQRK